MRQLPLYALLIGLLSLAGCDVNVTVNGDGEEPAATDSALESPNGAEDTSATAEATDEATSSDSEDGDLLNLNLPNVNVKIGGKDGVQVKAPGVDVNVNDENGVSVDAPGVDVDVNEKDGVSVDAPGTNVKVK